MIPLVTTDPRAPSKQAGKRHQPISVLQATAHPIKTSDTVRNAQNGSRKRARNHTSDTARHALPELKRAH